MPPCAHTFDAFEADAKRVRAFNNLTDPQCSCVGFSVRHNSRMDFGVYPEILSPIAKTPIRDRGMASVFSKSTGPLLPKAAY